MKLIMALVVAFLTSGVANASGGVKLRMVPGYYFGSFDVMKFTCFSTWASLKLRTGELASLASGEVAEVLLSARENCASPYVNVDTYAELHFELPYEFSRRITLGTNLDAMKALGVKVELLDADTGENVLALAANSGMKICGYYRGIYIRGMDKVPAERRLLVRLTNTSAGVVYTGLEVKKGNDPRLSIANNPGC